jgi:hypothetical protein
MAQIASNIIFLSLTHDPTAQLLRIRLETPPLPRAYYHLERPEEIEDTAGVDPADGDALSLCFLSQIR